MVSKVNKFFTVLFLLVTGCAYATVDETNEYEFSTDAGDNAMRFEEGSAYDSGKMVHQADGSTKKVGGGKARAWSQSGVLKVNDFANTMSMQAKFAPEDGKVFTVQFIVAPPVGPKAWDGLYFAYATISWSVNGTQVVRQVSVANGQAITGVGEAVRVIVQDQTPIFSPTNQTAGLPYEVTVTVAPGSRGNTSNPPFWAPPKFVFTECDEGGVSAQFVVPQNIGVISAQLITSYYDASGAIATPAQIEVQQITAAGFVISKTPIDSWGSGFVTLSPLCAVINLVNLGPAGATGNASVLFGIEG